MRYLEGSRPPGYKSLLRVLLDGSKLIHRGVGLHMPVLCNDLKVVAEALQPMLPHLHLTHQSVLKVLEKNATTIAGKLASTAIESARQSVRPIIAIIVGFEEASRATLSTRQEIGQQLGVTTIWHRELEQSQTRSTK